MQNFQLNYVMANFLSIDDTSKTYNLVMSLCEKNILISLKLNVIKLDMRT